MDLRSAMYAKPGLTVVLCGVVVLAVFGFAFFRASATPKAHYPVLGNYYTADEGQTYVPDIWCLIPPFDRDGKTWVRLQMFTTDGKTPIVGYLEKYDPDVQTELLAIDGTLAQSKKINALGDHGLLVKRPGDANWVAKESAEGATVMAVTSPDGRAVRPMWPEVPPKR